MRAKSGHSSLQDWPYLRQQDGRELRPCEGALWRQVHTAISHRGFHLTITTILSSIFRGEKIMAQRLRDWPMYLQLSSSRFQISKTHWSWLKFRHRTALSGKKRKKRERERNCYCFLSKMPNLTHILLKKILCYKYWGLVLQRNSPKHIQAIIQQKSSAPKSPKSPNFGTALAIKEPNRKFVVNLSRWQSRASENLRKLSNGPTGSSSTAGWGGAWGLLNKKIHQQRAWIWMRGDVVSCCCTKLNHICF